MDLSDMSVPPDIVREVADRYGLDAGEDPRERAVRVEGMAALLDGLAGEPASRTAPSVIEPGDDPHGAFRYRFRLGGVDGPLSDLDVAVKENVAVAGVPSTCGSAEFAYDPARSATVVDRLREAGATVVGTTNMDEFAYHTSGETCAHGPVANPAAEGHVPGGSSAGSGAAVAAGLVPAALGTDTGGSVRIPASFCGVVGLKPTFGAVSGYGVVPLSPSLDHVGPLAGSVETAATVFEAIAGPDLRDGRTAARSTTDDVPAAVGQGVEGLRVGVVREAMARASHPVTDAVESAVFDLDEAGADVDRISLSGFDDAPTVMSLIAGAEFAALVSHGGQAIGGAVDQDPELCAAFEALDGDGLGETVREQLLDHGTLTEATGGRNYAVARATRGEFTRTVAERFEEYDALVTPTTPTTAPEFGEISDDADLLETIANTAPFNLTGHPALSVPSETAQNRPVGLQFVADYGQEATAVRIGAAVAGDE